MDWGMMFWSFMSGFVLYDLLMLEDGKLYGWGRRIVRLRRSYGVDGASPIARTTSTTNAPEGDGRESFDFDLAVAQRVQAEILESDGDSHFHDQNQDSQRDMPDLSFSQDPDGTVRFTGRNDRMDVEFIGSPAAAWDHFKPWESISGLAAYAEFRYGPDWGSKLGRSLGSREG